jgi:anti-sigma factor RsiW
VRALLQDNPLQVASSDSHTVAPWFAGRVELAPTVKDLTAEGLPLVGGRLDLIGGQRVAVAVYRRNAHWINVYMWRADSPLGIAAGAAKRSGYNILTWQRDGVVYSAVSDINIAELSALERFL